MMSGLRHPRHHRHLLQDPNNDIDEHLRRARAVETFRRGDDRGWRRRRGRELGIDPREVAAALSVDTSLPTPPAAPQ
jgi:hypothetical protein